ncbi:M20/M25/M40 family metallo-hydrolase, partial [Candidatus Dependentiae bacterium]|nr:M20/M25/M40 family metallo-hydrolase [Candidatus Dependentiae bacterium]
SLPSLALSHHMDVVPIVDRSAWMFDPFGGMIHDGVIYGRGTQDMKGVGVAQYFGLKKFLDEGGQLKRTVHLILVPDEERGGFGGAGRLVEHPFFKQLRIGYALDECTPSGDPSFLNIKVSERKPIQVSFVSHGNMAHGSRIKIKNAAHQLVALLRKLVTFQDCQQLNALGQPAGLLLSVNITSLQFGTIKEGVVALNVVSDAATATVDIRVPPTMRLQDVVNYLNQLVSKYQSISYKIESTVHERSYDHSFHNNFYQAIERSIQKNSFTAQPFHAEESSDLRFYLEKGIVGFGLTPFSCKENLHGIDESIRVKDLEVGRNILCDLIKDFCS